MLHNIEIPTNIVDSEEVARRCHPETINLEQKKVNRNAFSNGFYPEKEISVDRTNFRDPESILSDPTFAGWWLGVCKAGPIRLVKFNENQLIDDVLSSPTADNPAHANILVNSNIETLSKNQRSKALKQLSMQFDLKAVSHSQPNIEAFQGP